MGKVFDALQRAEEQRARLAEEVVAPGAPAPIAGSARVAPEARTPRRRFWNRWLALRRRPEPEGASALNKRRISLLQPQSFVAEQFRTLRARLDSIATTRPLRTIALTSATPGDGKTTAAVNLAIVMSMGVGRRIALIDCDLRSPRVHECLGLRVEAGLGEVLRGTADVQDALIGVEGASLRVLPVRGIPPNPSELLASNKMREVIDKLSAQFDCVILDLPPVLGLPDAKVTSELCDGILLVVRAHATSRQDVQASLDVLDASRILGVVLNDADTAPGHYGYSG